MSGKYLLRHRPGNAVTAPSTGPVLTLGQVRQQLHESGTTVAFGITAYNEGPGIVVTLDSLWAGIQSLGLHAAPLFLSDSSDDPLTVQAAEEWARGTQCNLVVDHSAARRLPKAALNVILSSCRTDLLVVTNADLVIPAESLALLLGAALMPPFPDIAVGATWPDPSARGLRYRAGAWQLRVVQRLAARAPTDEVRAEGAFWCARRRFVEKFRFPEGSGSIADDVELQRAVVSRGYRGANVSSAIVYKIPAGSPHDFALQTRRYHFAVGDQPPRRSRQDWSALRFEAARDPIGAVLYCAFRCYAFVFRRQIALATDKEMWEPAATTKRGVPDVKP
jgi:hypothetical protein